MLLEEYILYIEEKFDPEEIDIKISSVSIHTEQPALDLIISLEEEEIRSEKVLLGLINCKEVKLRDAVFSDIQLMHKHPLLWKYNDFQSSLFFNGAAEDQYRLFWSLYRAHRNKYEDLLPFDTYLNTAFLERDYFLPSSGIFAKGPRKLMNIYAECLEKEGIQCSQTNIAPPMLWDGSKYTEGFQHPKILFLNNSFIIADDFILRERIPIEL